MTWVARRSINGINLEVSRISANRYVRITRASDGAIIWKYSQDRFVGKLRQLYDLFESVSRWIPRSAVDGDRPDLDTLKPLTRLLFRSDSGYLTSTFSDACDSVWRDRVAAIALELAQ